MNKYILAKLNNGLRIILLPKNDAESVTLLTMIKTGSLYENKKNNGISHFLEHMLFKGTKKRPSPLEISQAIEGVGGLTNAFTSKEYTGYYIQIYKDHFEKALDIISDIYQNSLFDEQEIENEKKVIIEEINMYNDLPQHYANILFESLLYGDQPAGWNIAGTKDNIVRFVKNDFLDYINNHYSALNTIVCVAGNFNIDDAKTKIKHFFGSIKKFKPKSKTKTKEKQNKPQIILHYKETDQAHIYLGFKAYNIFNEKKRTLALLSTILGGNMSSRLWQKIREEMGAAYYISSSTDFYSDHGHFSVNAGLNINLAEKAIQTILNEFTFSLEKNLREEEISKAKEFIKGTLILHLEDSFNLANFYTSQELILNKIITPKETIKKIEKITKDDIIKTAREVFNPKKLNLAIIGPFKEEKIFTKILKSYHYKI